MPVNITMSMSPDSISVPSSPDTNSEPASPVDNSQPAAPANNSQPAAPANNAQSAAPANNSQPAAPVNQARPILVLDIDSGDDNDNVDNEGIYHHHWYWNIIYSKDLFRENFYLTIRFYTLRTSKIHWEKIEK